MITGTTSSVNKDAYSGNVLPSSEVPPQLVVVSRLARLYSSHHLDLKTCLDGNDQELSRASGVHRCSQIFHRQQIPMEN
jgi:hypothetical protein